jgi:hypothetical protein
VRTALRSAGPARTAVLVAAAFLTLAACFPGQTSVATAGMPDRMTQAFYAAVRAYVKDPGSLDTELAGLDKVQAEVYR